MGHCCILEVVSWFEASAAEGFHACVSHRSNVSFHLSAYCATVVDDVQSLMSASAGHCLWEERGDIVVPQERLPHL